MSWSRLPKTYAEMKAGNEDHKYLVSALKPKYIMPMNGLYSEFVRYQKLMNKAFPWIEILIAENGKVFNFNGPNYNSDCKNTIEIEEKYISNNFLSDMNGSLLRERKQMSLNGILMVNVLNKKVEDKIESKCIIESYGLIDSTTKDQELLKEMTEQIQKFSSEKLVSKEYDQKEYKNDIKKIASKLIEKKLNKTPIVLTTVISL